jgi:hypothetical protein
VFLPAATVAALGPSSALTLGGFWPSAQPAQGWYVRVRAGGQLSVVGTRDTGAAIEFPIFASVPVDRWFTFELGLHSQQGPGVKRAFAVFIDGIAHGWFRHGRMADEVYDRVALGIVGTTAASALEVFVDDWGAAGVTPLPTGPDARSSAPLASKDFRTGNGADWQIDWATWANDLRLHTTYGLYSNVDRLQSGINLDRTPSLADGWGEIEIDWPKGRPPDTRPNGYFGPMIGFRKEVNREQNLEVIPRGNGDGTVDLLVEAWDGLGPVVLAQWPLPTASFGGSSIPEPGDVIRVRWTQVTPTALEVRASYFDASAGAWAVDAIAGVYDVGNVNGVNFNDGFHGASSVTIDSQFYSIRRYHVGTPATYPGAACSVTVSPGTVAVPAAGAGGSLAITAHPSCAWTAAAPPWISLTGATSGSGSGTVPYSVAANTTAVERSGSVTVGGQVVSFVQAGAPGGAAVLQVADTVVTEGSSSATTATFLVTLSGPSPAPVSVNFSAGSDAALVGADFQPAAGTLTFAPGETSKAVAVSVIGDLLDEPAETFVLTLSTPSGAAIADGVATGLIVDNDPTPTLAVSDATAVEGTTTAGSLGFVVTLSAASGYVVQVNYATAAGTASAGTDFVAAAGTLTFAPGVTAQALPVALVADGLAESTETLQVTLTTAQNAVIADGLGAGTIADDDAPTGPATLVLAVAAGADDVNEVTNTLTAADTTLFVGTATGLSHAGLRFSGVSIPAGATVTSARLQVRASATQWNAMQFEWAAEASGNAAPFTASSRPSQRALGTARVAHASDAQWIAGTWYTLEELAPVLQGVVARPDWAAGNSVALVLRGTGGSWSRKFFSAFESGAANAARLVVSYVPSGAPPPPPSLSVNDVSVVEGTGTATSAVFTVTLSAPRTQTVTVGYVTANGTATAPADYAASSGTVTFAPGVTTQSVSVALVPDTLVEANETFTVTLQSPVNATLGDASGTGTISNDDAAPPPVPAVAVNDVSVVEGTGTAPSAVFTVTLSAASAQTVTVGYLTANGTATAPSDYAASSGTVTFAPGVTSQPVSVAIVPDAVVEANETFTLTLQSPVNATLGDASGTGTITNDDAAGGPATVTVPIGSGADDVNQEGAAVATDGATVWLGSGASAVPSYAGLRFASVAIPRNAVITSARLEVQAASTQWLTIGFEVGLEAAASSAPFSAAAPPSGRALLTPRLTHSSNSQWVAGTWYSFGDLSPMIQALVSRADWTTGNALSLLVRGTGPAYGRKFARSFEGGAATAPRLIVTYVMP